jgi:anti-anti-sigma factor
MNRASGATDPKTRKAKALWPDPSAKEVKAILQSNSSVLPQATHESRTNERRTNRRDAPATAGSSIQTHGSEMHIRPNGRLDAHSVTATLEPATVSFLNVCMDLSNVHFVDMGALRTLERLQQQCRNEGREMRLINLRDPVRLTVEITGFKSRLPIEHAMTKADAQFEELIQELFDTIPQQLLKSV